MNARKDSETYAEYCVRRLALQYREKLRARGRLFWDSAKQGTYRRPKPVSAI